VFTFCSGTGNDALLFYQYIITTACLANRKKGSIRNQCCKIQINKGASFPVPEQNVNTLPVYQENVENGMKTKSLLIVLQIKLIEKNKFFIFMPKF
jgi:hypothetical protein